MAWKKTDFIVKRRLNQHGLGQLVEAGAVCRKAELLFPDLFHAVSLRENTLHIALPKKNLLAFRLIQGKLLSDLAGFAHERSLPVPSSIRLTIEEK